MIPAPPQMPEYKVESTGKVLRRLFLTVFLRGHSARGISRDTAPKSIWQKLGFFLFIYGVFGFFVILIPGQPLFSLAILMHSITFVMIAMFLTTTAGETLFNKEESDILLHRPVLPRDLLWSKISVLVLVSLYMAGAINFAGTVVAPLTPNGTWLFPIVHILSTAAETLLCASSVVLLYQVCLRWIGRERLESVMTTLQVLFIMAFFLGSQVLPQVFIRSVGNGQQFTMPAWVDFLPPTWFAGLDDGLAGSHSPASLLLGIPALAITALAAWLAFVKLANVYASGAAAMNEAIAPKLGEKKQTRILQTLISIPPLSWVLKDKVDRASFCLLGAYLYRDRDVKLRLYPGLAPFLMLPFISLFTRSMAPGHVGFDMSPFMFSLSGAYVGFLPLYSSAITRYSQQWRATEVFRLTPVQGPWPVQRGAQWAMCALFAFPLFVILSILVIFITGPNALLLLIPGMISLPFFAMLSAFLDPAVPFSVPSEEAKAFGRGCALSAVMMIPMVFAGATVGSWEAGIFPIFLAAEIILVVLLCFLLSANLKKRIWPMWD